MKKEIMEDLKFYMAQLENAEKFAQEANMEVEEFVNRTRKGLIEILQMYDK